MDKKLFIGYAGVALLLFLYSYTQVDLSLTLSRVSIFQTVQKSFQYIGYYQRPLSSGLFLGIMGALFVLYIIALRRLSVRTFWAIVPTVTVLLLFSYPAFSYDIFNYMFDAKTVLVYGKLPYAVTPLQFSGIEPWLSFMHWTHIPSVFMPFWILVTLPFYLLGFGYFLGILWSFKLLAAGAYIVTVWLIWKILKKLDSQRAVLGAAVFALNPLVIVESLVSGHNDIVMMALAMAAFYLYLQKKHVWSFIALSASIATKVMTLPLLILFLVGWRRSWALVVTAIGCVVFLVITKREIQPWYVMWLLPWVALLPRSAWLTVLASGASLGLLLRYVPFLYTGGYAPPVPALMQWLVIVPTVGALGVVFARKMKLQV